MKLKNLETELLLSPKNYSKEYINEQIRKTDIGIFSKFSTFDTDDKGKLVPKYENEQEKDEAFINYWTDLDTGSVFRNSDEKGQKLIKDAGPYLVKGLFKGLR